MTEQGYSNRIFAIEWHAELWRRSGYPRDLCEAVMRHASEAVSADYYGGARLAPESDDPEVAKICCDVEAYFDRLFNSPHRGPVSFD